MSVGIIIQARMNSTRLPGKVLMPIKHKPLLQIQLERLKNMNVQHLIIATTLNASDDVLVDFCKSHNVLCFRGDEQDVLARYYDCACFFELKTIVRLTSDCPFIDTTVVQKVLNEFLLSGCDYVSNTLERTYPRGYDTEVFTMQALHRAYTEANQLHEREHVTPYFYKNPNLFKLKNVACLQDIAKYRLTVDTPEDFKLIEKIYSDLSLSDPFFTLEMVQDYLKKHPQYLEWNAQVQQKSL